MHSRVWIAAAIAMALTVSKVHAAPDREATPKGDDGGEAGEATPPKTGGDEPALAPEPVHAKTAPAEELVVPPKYTWEPYGYLRLQYRVVQNDPNVAYIGRDDGFELQNARVGVRGTLGGDRAAYALAIDGAVDERAQINVPEGKLRVGLRDAWVDVGLASKVVLRAGFFQPWVDPESLVGDTSRELVDKPIESRGVRATEGYQTPGLTPGRSLGAALRIDRRPGAPSSPGVGFELAVQNGADEYSSNNDNDTPAISAAFIAHLPREGHFIGAVRWNPRTAGALPFRQDETDVQGTLGLHLVAGPASIGFGAIGTHTTFSTTNGPSQNAFGAHAQLMFVVPASLPFAVGYRFGILDPSSLLLTDRVMEHTVGSVLSVPSLRMRVQLQVTHVVEERTLSNSRAQLALEVAL